MGMSLMSVNFHGLQERCGWSSKSDNVEEMKKKILDFGVRKLELPDPHLYFQAPGGQCWRLVGIDEDLSFYEGRGEGPNVAKIKEGAAKGF